MDKFIQWFSGGDNQYMTLWHCMNHDTPWITAKVILCLAVIVGYLIIAYHWYSNLATLKPGLAKRSLFNMVNIFLFCGACGYLFDIIEVWWPIHRLHVMFLAVLSYFTISYAASTPKLRVVYEELHNAGELTEKLEAEQSLNKDLYSKIEEVKKPVEKMSNDVFYGLDDSISPKTQESFRTLRERILEVEGLLNEILNQKKEKESNE